MGIFARSGGDRRRFGGPITPNGKVETGGKRAKARHWRAFLATPEQVSQTPEWLAGAGGFEPSDGELEAESTGCQV